MFLYKSLSLQNIPQVYFHNTFSSFVSAFVGAEFYPDFSFLPSIARLRFRLVKSSAKLMIYVDTQTIQKSPRTKARIHAK